MKNVLAILTAIALAAALTPASAETSQDRTLKAPEKSMGDHGKLPVTKNMGNAVPDMTGPRTDATPATDESSGSSPKGPAKRMGDEKGKLPATNTMTDQVPKMTGPDATK